MSIRLIIMTRRTLMTRLASSSVPWDDVENKSELDMFPHCFAQGVERRSVECCNVMWMCLRYLNSVKRFGQRPGKIAFLAWHAWRDAAAGEWPTGFPEHRKSEYDLGEIAKWLETFLKRFFGFSQFKRSAIPNGPKVSSAGALSPRGDWRAPSDAVADVWLAELRTSLPERSK